ncbi:alternative ribosome rescue aminoacyl-tRNA hydrolase ArfB [Glutamicibacter sp. NPDC087344]|uniref:alternative ribosome rescue aminoacyl-tRNA hydrolase ArfB n=1 Tax=Glutamicibacter sp. NPDC087344 TaxID=3363994 RepID=UPI0037F9DB2C
MDLQISRSLVIPAAELVWHFTRSSGPGGQHVNTSDSRVELSWSIAGSRVLSPWQRQRLLAKLSTRLTGGQVVVTSAQERSQWRNRQDAAQKLTELVQATLLPDPPQRRATKPTQGSQRRRLSAKSNRAATKQLRRRPAQD